MSVLKTALKLLLSLKTTAWLLLALLCLLFYGSLVMPAHQEYQSMQAAPLFDWIGENRPGITWWLWGAVVFLSLLTANTIFCSIESLFRKREARNWLIIISPQVIHMGFLFILLAHLMSSYGSFKGHAYAYKGAVLPLPSGSQVFFRDVQANVDASGYVTDWSAQIQYYRDGRIFRNDLVAPNSPSFENGVGIYIQTVRVAPFPVALIEISREPGAPWALAGGVLFLAGSAALLFLKTMREEKAGL